MLWSLKKGPKPTLTSKRRSLFIDALHTMYTFGWRAYRYRSARVMHIWCFLHYPNLQKNSLSKYDKKACIIIIIVISQCWKKHQKQPRKYKRFLLFYARVRYLTRRVGHQAADKLIKYLGSVAQQ